MALLTVGGKVLLAGGKPVIAPSGGGGGGATPAKLTFTSSLASLSYASAIVANPDGTTSVLRSAEDCCNFTKELFVGSCIGISTHGKGLAGIFAVKATGAVVAYGNPSGLLVILITEPNATVNAYDAD